MDTILMMIQGQWLRSCVPAATCLARTVVTGQGTTWGVCLGIYLWNVLQPLRPTKHLHPRDLCILKVMKAWTCFALMILFFHHWHCRWCCCDFTRCSCFRPHTWFLIFVFRFIWINHLVRFKRWGRCLCFDRTNELYHWIIISLLYHCCAGTPEENSAWIADWLIQERLKEREDRRRREPPETY